jgi:hypothetical protein
MSDNDKGRPREAFYEAGRRDPLEQTIPHLERTAAHEATERNIARAWSELDRDENGDPRFEPIALD